jgi:hypothetical protein
LKNICEDVIKQNDYFLMKRKLAGFVIVEDPVSASQSLKYPPNVNAVTVEDFNKYSQKEQIAILSSSSLPIFPIVDTVIIVDTLKFFSEGEIFCSGKYCFAVKRKADKKATSKCISIYAVGVRGNNLILSLSFKNSNELLNYYFSLKLEAVSLLKTLIVDKTPVAE